MHRTYSGNALCMYLQWIYPRSFTVLINVFQTDAMVLGQNYHEAIIRSHLEKLGVHVEFGHELRTFTQSEDSVTAEIVKHEEGADVPTVEKAEYSYLVGCDGAYSVVRRTLGLNFVGETDEEQGIVFGDIKTTTGHGEVSPCPIFRTFSNPCSSGSIGHPVKYRMVPLF